LWYYDLLSFTADSEMPRKVKLGRFSRRDGDENNDQVTTHNCSMHVAVEVDAAHNCTIIRNELSSIHFFLVYEYIRIVLLCMIQEARIFGTANPVSE
jgi:hypothetical protein